MVGRFDNEERARQLLSFDGMNIGKKCFTDIDAVMEYRDRCWIFFEVKHGNKEVPLGQRLALERMTRDVSSNGKHAVAAVVEHRADDPRDNILLRNCVVRSVYSSNELRWRPPNEPMTAHRLMTRYTDWIDRLHGFDGRSVQDEMTDFCIYIGGDYGHFAQ